MKQWGWPASNHDNAAWYGRRMIHARPHMLGLCSHAFKAPHKTTNGNNLGPRLPGRHMGCKQAHERYMRDTRIHQAVYNTKAICHSHMFTTELSPNYHPAMLRQNAPCTLASNTAKTTPSRPLSNNQACKACQWQFNLKVAMTATTHPTNINISPQHGTDTVVSCTAR